MSSVSILLLLAIAHGLTAYGMALPVRTEPWWQSTAVLRAGTFAALAGLLLAPILGDGVVLGTFVLLVLARALIHEMVDRARSFQDRPFAALLTQVIVQAAALLGWWAVAVARTQPADGTAPGWHLPWQKLAATSWGLAMVAALAGWVVVCRLGTMTVRSLLEQLRATAQQPSESRGADGAGRVIGNLERTLIFFLVLVGQYGAIGFVLAAKSLARFEDFKKQDFAEYYLVGTLTSAAVAFVVGIGVLASWRAVGFKLSL